MIASLTGIVHRMNFPELHVTVHGVGYLVMAPLPLYEEIVDGEERMIHVYSYIREDRFDLFGFHDSDTRLLFNEFLNLSGIGPKTALELCSIPREYLFNAARNDDTISLTKIKGIGKKTAEKLLIDLRQLLEKHPEWSHEQKNVNTITPAPFDNDAIVALMSLGYDRQTIVTALKNIPSDITKTEDRIKMVLKTL